MTTFRLVTIASIAAAIALATAGAAAPATGPVPVVRLTGSVSPGRRPIPPHTRLTLQLDTRLDSVPHGADLVLQHLDYLFGHGTVVNGRLFPSCSAAALAKAHGSLSACPRGSKIGSGTVTGTAIAIGVTSTGRLTMFNGPGGRSLTMNISIVTPALIDATFSAPFTAVRGRYANKLSIPVPDSLKTVLGGDVVATRIDVTTGATRVVHGVERGYIEAVSCPRRGNVPIHGDFVFDHGARASADTTVAC